MNEAIPLILKNTLSITFFVLVMMLIIEYINVKTAGAFSKRIKKTGFRQILIGSLLGIIPGCLGTYTVVTLYTHKLVSFGALTAAFIATMGDEAFMLFSTAPNIALIMSGIMLAVAIVSGLLIDRFSKFKKPKQSEDVVHFHIHEDEIPESKSKKELFIENFKNPSPHRALLVFGAIAIILFSIFSDMGHNHEFLTSAPNHELHAHDHSSHAHEHGGFVLDWIQITFISISLIALYILSVVPEHFLEDHFWNHIIKKHFLKILGWTSLVITGVYVLNQYLNVHDFIDGYMYHILIIAVLVGLIPESGPHVIFLSLFLSGAIPLSILLANSIVQDGHGALPLFAENKKAFFKVKIINLFVGLVIGIIGLQTGL